MKKIRSLFSESSSDTHDNVNASPSTENKPSSNRGRKQNHSHSSRRSDRNQSNLQRGWQMIQKLSFPTNNNLQPSTQIEETLYPPVSSEKSSLISYFDVEPGIADSKGGEPKQCRICHMTTENSKKKIISPCRCTGTMKYVHTACVANWLQISSSTAFFLPKFPTCELCKYQYKTHPFYCVFRRIRMPYITNTDIIMHILFFLLISIMIFCGATSFHYLHLSLHRRHPRRDNRVLLTKDEIAMITAAIFFFVSFIMALLTQYRADCTLFRLATRFWSSNKLWIIKNYEADDDKEVVAHKSNLIIQTV